MVPSESRVGTPEPLNERYPTKTAGAPGVASVSGRTSAASKAQVKLIGHAFVGIVAKASPQPNTAPIKTTISENLFIPTLFLAPMLKLPAASQRLAREPIVETGIEESKLGTSVSCDKTQRRAVRREIECAGRPTAARGASASHRLQRSQHAVFVLLTEGGRYWCRAAVEDNVTDDNARSSRMVRIVQRPALHSTERAFEVRDRTSAQGPGGECAAAEDCERTDHGDDE